MSSTHGGDALDPSNHFRTPDWATDAVIPYLPLGGVIVDAGCGEGAILHRMQLAARDASFLGIELDTERAERCRVKRGGAGTAVMAGDWLDPACHIDADLVVSNPPFSLAQPFIERALEFTARRHGTVAMLLRATWHVPQCRAPFAFLHPFDLGTLSRRPDFVASLKCKAKCGWKIMQPIEAPRPKACPTCGKPVTVVTTDSADYAWHIWGPGRGHRFFPLSIPSRSPTTTTVGVDDA
jgi:predicted RNA methylase